MAAPSNKNLQDLSGKWQMNRKLSDDVNGVLELQGFNSLMRKAIAHAPVYLHISQSKEGDDTKYKIDQKTTASIPAVNEEWITDWEIRESKDAVMGRVKAKARWSKTDEVDDKDFLDGGWLDEGPEQIEAFVESVDAGWTAHQIWGFEEIEERRTFVRRVVVRKDEKTQQVRLVYDYLDG